MAEFAFPPILSFFLSFLLFFIYIFFCTCLEEGVDNPGAVSMLVWLFEMNNYLAVAQRLLFVK